MLFGWRWWVPERGRATELVHDRRLAIWPLIIRPRASETAMRPPCLLSRPIAAKITPGTAMMIGIVNTSPSPPLAAYRYRRKRALIVPDAEHDE
jgi:hypothetical protein